MVNLLPFSAICFSGSLTIGQVSCNLLLSVEFLQADTASHHRLHWDAKPHTATHHLVHWVFVFCRGKHANCNVLRLVVGPHYAHLLVLSRVCKDIPLATNHSAVSLPSVSGEKTQCSSQSYRFVRLRPRPAASGNNFVYPFVLSSTHRDGLLSQFCHC